MATNFPLYSHPLRAKVVMLKGAKGDAPSASVEQTSTGATVTVTDRDGTTTANLTNGVSVTSATINNNNHLIITKSNGSTVDCGSLGAGPVDTTLSASSTDAVANNAVYNSVVGKLSSFGISANLWTELSNKEPYKYHVTANLYT